MKLVVVLILTVIVFLNFNYASGQFSLEELDQLNCRYTLRIGTNIDRLNFVMPGQYYPIYIFLDSIGEAPLRGFDLSIAYNPSHLELGNVGPASAINCWDNFEYEVTPLYEKGHKTNLNLINIFASTSADFELKDEPECMGESGYFETVPTRLVRLNFLVKTNEDISFGPILPIYFYWQNCQSNVISAGNQQVKFICDKVNSPRKFLPEKDQTYFTVSDEIIPDNHLDAISDSCKNNVNSQNAVFNHSVYFINGGLFVELHACTRIFRGDLDLDNVGHTIKDLHLFADYFIYGDSVFTVDRAKQLWETDVNQDNLALSLADFTYIWREL